MPRAHRGRVLQAPLRAHGRPDPRAGDGARRAAEPVSLAARRAPRRAEGGVTLTETDMRWNTTTSTDDLSELLWAVSVFVRRFVVVTPEQLVAISLWIAHTHTINAADCT